MFLSTLLAPQTLCHVYVHTPNGTLGIVLCVCFQINGTPGSVLCVGLYTNGTSGLVRCIFATPLAPRAVCGVFLSTPWAPQTLQCVCSHSRWHLGHCVVCFFPTQGL